MATPENDSAKNQFFFNVASLRFRLTFLSNCCHDRSTCMSCMCVRERERQTEKGRQRDRETQRHGRKDTAKLTERDREKERIKSARNKREK
jgi:hypothetical protein